MSVVNLVAARAQRDYRVAFVNLRWATGALPATGSL